MGESNAASSRNVFIDSFKGVLILLVVIGHILPGTLYNNPARYVIYSFHMPVFFFISGYLTNVSKIQSSSIKSIAIRYIKRIIIPWVVAVQVYFVINSIVSNNFSVVAYIKSYVVPYYHLWYGIGYLFCVLLVVVVLKTIKSIDSALTIILIIGIVFAIIYILRLFWSGTNLIIELVEYTLRPWNMAFFSIGVFVRNKESYHLMQNSINRISKVSLLLFVVLMPFGYMFQELALEPLVRFLLIGIILFGFNVDKYKANNSVLVFLGKETYPIYLWHVIGKAVAANLDSFLYYIVSIMWVIILMLMLMIIKKNHPIRAIIGR